VSYFYKWIPAVAIVTLFILSLPWLGLIALVVVLAALALLAGAMLYVAYRFVLAISHRWTSHGGARRRAAAAVPVHGHRYAYAPARRIDYQTSEPGHATESISAGVHDGVLSQPLLRERDMP
jgi:hypothetical protein